MRYIRGSFCLKCGKPLPGEQEEYCADCNRRRHFFDRGRALLSYQGPVRESLYRLKYGNKRDYARVYGEEMVRMLGKWILRNHIDRIVPIPLHPSRRRDRGYNQAALLARPISRYLDIPLDETLIKRTKRTVRQKDLTDRERFNNLKNAFLVTGPVAFREHILLVDDIYTTGSTVDGAARALKERENCKIYVVTAAIGG